MNKLFLTALLLYCVSSFAQFSNMIVFGDSLSDGGNFPESSQIWWNPKAPKTVSNSIAQFYVPFSNPVDTHSPSLSFSWPVLDNLYLPAQAVFENNTAIRKYRSISWPQFFLALAKTAGSMKNEIIVPSDLLNTRKIPATLSFNYAWGFATSGENCVNPYYKTVKCNAKSIFQARENYEKNQSKENYQKIEIPGLSKQIQLFLQDYREHKVSVDKNTLYTFWIGGNDLIVSNNALEKNKNPLSALDFIMGGPANHVLKNVSMLVNSLPKDQRPKTVYVFTLFNPALTPGYFGTKLGSVANFAVHCYNFWLKYRVGIYNLFSRTKIIVLPTYQWYEKSSDSNYFKSHEGQACQISGGNYESPTTIPKSNCAGFMFWNAVHPAAPMNFFEAYQFLNVMKKK